MDFMFLNLIIRSFILSCYMIYMYFIYLTCFLNLLVVFYFSVWIFIRWWNYLVSKIYEGELRGKWIFILLIYILSYSGIL